MQTVKRHSCLSKKTAETEIALTLDLDGTGKNNIHTGLGFFDHMLDLAFFWGAMDLSLTCKGDLQVDAHHTMEDAGLLLGEALYDALGDKIGISRVGYGRVPMDEALCEVTLDFSGRPWLEWHGDHKLPPVIAGEEKDVWREFYKSLAAAGRFNLHINFVYGKNGHHLLEACAKAFGVAMKQAKQIESSSLRSTKGVLN